MNKARTPLEISARQSASGGPKIQILKIGGHDVRKLEPKYQVKRLTIWTLDPIIQELRAMFKQNPEWFEVPKPKSDKGKNEVDYSI